MDIYKGQSIRNYAAPPYGDIFRRIKDYVSVSIDTIYRSILLLSDNNITLGLMKPIIIDSFNTLSKDLYEIIFPIIKGQSYENMINEYVINYKESNIVRSWLIYQLNILSFALQTLISIMEGLIDLSEKDEYIINKISDFDKTMKMIVLVSDHIRINITSVLSERTVNITIYLSENKDVEKIEDSVKEFIEIIGLEIYKKDEPVISSYRRKMLSAIRNFIEKADIEDKLIKSQRAIEIQYIRKAQAEADNAMADGLSKVISSLSNIETAVIITGSLMIIKHGEKIISRNLNQDELAFIDNNPTMLSNPMQVLEKIEGMKDQKRLLVELLSREIEP